MKNYKEYLESREQELKMLDIMEDIESTLEIIEQTAERFEVDKAAVMSYIFHITQ